MDTLKLTTPMMHGSAVNRLQEFGDLLGLDSGPNDGIFGQATEGVVKELQRRFGLTVDGVCGPKTWAAILQSLDRKAFDGVDGIFDRRGLHSRPKLFGYLRAREKITGITLHQTGCQMPTSPRGWDRLNAHIGISHDGKVIIANDPKNMIWHAQALSKHTIGIEIAGNYPGLIDDASTLWKGGGGPHRLNDMMLKGLDLALDWIVERYDIRAIYAHRQSAPSRVADPGEEIWRKVAVPWAERLGINLADTMRESFGKGRQIPIEWRPGTGPGREYWR